jgi:hypothetical protein
MSRQSSRPPLPPEADIEAYSASVNNVFCELRQRLLQKALPIFVLFTGCLSSNLLMRLLKFIFSRVFDAGDFIVGAFHRQNELTT